MALFTVHAPRKADGVAADPAGLVFIKDGFCWPALFVPILWLAYRGLWLSLLVYLVLGIGLAALSSLAGPDASTAVMVLFAFWFALEANGLRRWTVERRRYGLVGVVEGRSLEEAERRWFDEAAGEAGSAAAVAAPLPPAAALTPSPSPPPSPPPPRAAPGIVGLFPTPGTGR